VLGQHQRRRARQRQRRLGLLGLQRDALALAADLMGEADRCGVEVGEVDVLPAQPEQLALPAADDGGEAKQRQPRLLGRGERAGELRRAVDPPLRRVPLTFAPLAGLQQGDRALRRSSRSAGGRT
jgi:hypothetical protein